ncbi:defensin [Anopheles gambiae]|uniref:Defensin n=3 Tax=gambiae species complex TaxID=44542 RepID=Q38L94_ANOQN|nr:defensin [Anopheles gambiae]ABB00988.1 defensin [Anopheles quadriannulatus]ABB00967.1 defensin [Anopheles gambiae]ABB00969.1 defensin [Anopheles gambiae]ABB00973.1 defensin [Anopheles gambiae]ABB00975.1 defensin [Anopheles gambiae]
MKCATIVCTIAVVLAATLLNGSVQAAPQEEAALGGGANLNTLLDELPEETHHAALENYRAKRATCDLASGFGVGSSLCAAHCIARRYRGGYCNSKAVCVCRN